jgi:hypothetical protein
MYFHALVAGAGEQPPGAGFEIVITSVANAIKCRARGATLQELAHSYAVGISTIRRVTRTA